MQLKTVFVISVMAAAVLAGCGDKKASVERAPIEVATMTATPIPRTLHLSLSANSADDRQAKQRTRINRTTTDHIMFYVVQFITNGFNFRFHCTDYCQHEL